MTIFVTLQLRVTLDSIRNSCDVFLEILEIFLPGMEFNRKLIENTSLSCVDVITHSIDIQNLDHRQQK